MTQTPAFRSTINPAGNTPSEYFPRRRAELIEAAEVSTRLAGVVLGYGDEKAARDLQSEVCAMLAEIKTIDSLTEKATHS